MRHIATFHTSLRALEFQQTLQEAGIATDLTVERDYLYRPARHLIWAADEADPLVIARIYQSFQEDSGDRTDSDAGLPTRVDVTEDLTKCKRCDYDLRGQVAGGNCPECGHPYILIQYVKCPNCRRDVPSDFAVCWNCNHEMAQP